MQVDLIAFSERGLRLADRIMRGLRDTGCAARTAKGFGTRKEELAGWCARAFAHSDALVFVGAAGIAVRAIAPHVCSKETDPAVVCIDEGGTWCIPLLSGHIGGANELARRIAAMTGSHACITTATDVNGLWAPDDWAMRAGLAIADVSRVKGVSAKLLAGNTVTIGGTAMFDGEPPASVDIVGPHESPDVWVGPSSAGDALWLIPRCLVLGIGCRRSTPYEAIDRAAGTFIAEQGYDVRALSAVASIDLKADEQGLVAFARQHGVPFKTFSAQRLNDQPGTFAASPFVEGITGTDNVCERAVAAAGAEVVVRKTVVDGIALALGMLPHRVSFDLETPSHGACASSGVLQVVGIGPGNERSMTGAALDALRSADLVCGYDTYLDLVRPIIGDTPTFSTPMRGEVARCRAALDAAAVGKRVALVCSGDAGVYGMAGLVLELSEEYPDVEVQVIPGVTAALAGAALLGAPLGHDFAVVSLSDLLTDWDTVERRLRAAAESDLALALYNPASRKRTGCLRRACDILLEHKPAGTACGVARNVGRPGEAAWTCTLGELRTAELDMFCIAFVGNASTRDRGGLLVTPRSYRLDAVDRKGEA